MINNTTGQKAFNKTPLFFGNNTTNSTPFTNQGAKPNASNIDELRKPTFFPGPGL